MSPPHRDEGDAGAEQAFATPGVAPMGRPTLWNRALMRVVAAVERLNVARAKLGNRTVYDTALFPWARDLEREWPAIRAELDAVLADRERLPAFQDILADVRTITRDDAWKVFPLGGYGVVSSRNIARCPRTWRAVRRIPGFRSATFSIFEPGKHLPPHRGAYNGVLRLHLGLVVPRERDKVAIRVGDAVRHWEEGRVLIFDDAYEHEAWNHSQEIRVVLFVDFVKPLRFPANIVNRLLLSLAVFTPFVREGAENLQEWERRHYPRP
ncbi:beta-hydroxylase [Streptoalloteichus tenebrarius]|uniref:Beta-hydroxylase n=1 Tax=Streptoalloteichus tenebrarius (strain ATCC 17920 / DSM 40477 / JCM 4838 / CBS 697.72 / NBRC 16177 / NCIMB 11028 / NRRL B-12390 / A12253. 1 / ISP 5477) TaxID=1933 RepID=A0ABT1HUP9_STRSD|nr:aspartyl/asparaginyl beta-hydroxylase domain-containing protein [Streptoalloteichus tenebrarius]MCP2259247.1 beta-hydroxylase [Streptoalloteichus tenebrarius]BFE99005.1 hypothetical protein GCM10020241_06810 [Streptoalloteichus tenebrarius]